MIINLFINSPSYYTEEYGVMDDIYNLCKLISDRIDITLYTDALDTIGITPIIAPKQVLDSGCMEVKMISMRYRMANISLYCDYNNFIKADLALKKVMIAENIINSLYVIKKRLKNKFNYTQIVNDIKNLLHECF